MADGGDLRVTVRPADDVGAIARRHEGFRADRAAVLEVVDSGSGMDADTASKMFEPFFTTKPSGQGVGLMTVYGVARQSGGAVEVASDVGRGTTVRIFLPLADVEPA
jgi:signal transduction histidine kinase